jgi:hypothetical protein
LYFPKAVASKLSEVANLMGRSAVIFNINSTNPTRQTQEDSKQALDKWFKLVDDLEDKLAPAMDALEGEMRKLLGTER